LKIKNIKDKVEELRDKKAVLFYKNGEVAILEVDNSIDLSNILKEYLKKDLEYFYIRGAITPKIIEAFINSRGSYEKITLLAEDGTKFEYAVPTYAPTVAELSTLNINNGTVSTPSKSENSLNSSVKEEKKADAASTAPAATSIKVGVMAGPEHQVAETAAKVAKDKYNLNVEFVLFNDYALPNTAVSKGDLDANAMQHKPYLDEDVKAKNLNNLVIVGNTFVYPLAGYSKTIKNVNELKDGAKVVVPNDPSNRGRALILLEKQGLIKLKNSNDLLSTVADIVENPKNLKISEVDTSVAARALDDVDLAVVNNTYAGQVGLNAQDNGVFVEDKDSPYVNIIVARTDNKDSKAIQDFVKAYQTEEVYQEAKKHFKDGVVKGW